MSIWSRARRRDSRPARPPRLSVVVPVYNVERYLADCLDSLLAQSFADFEAILVIDGATDGSTAIAEAYAGRDSRLRLLRQANAGLGAARNTGVGAARGDYLTFLDSDDTLPRGAYQALMSSVERTGSEIAIGTLVRGTEAHHSSLRLMKRNHERRQERAAVDDVPLILADVFAVNKVYRRSFWDAAGLFFPEGLRYEDQPTITRALVAASTFDVLTDIVYFWRARDDGTSISQRRHELADLSDRLESKRSSTAAIASLSSPRVQEVWYGEVLPVDMWEYFRAVPGCSDEYWQLLRSAMAEFWPEDGFSFEQTAVPENQRMMGSLVSRGCRRELEAFIERLDASRSGRP